MAKVAFKDDALALVVVQHTVPDNLQGHPADPCSLRPA